MNESGLNNIWLGELQWAPAVVHTALLSWSADGKVKKQKKQPTAVMFFGLNVADQIFSEGVFLWCDVHLNCSFIDFPF